MFSHSTKVGEDHFIAFSLACEDRVVPNMLRRG
jgi:hypothetical protein